METIIRKLIADFSERTLPELTKRSAQATPLAGKAQAIIGMRRAGKTWFLYQQMTDLLRQGMEKNRLLYINFEDERLHPFSRSDFDTLLDAFYQNAPALKEQTCYFFFDEIQLVQGWEQFVRRVMDNENVRVYITGSSAKLLSREIATSLRGRSLSCEIFPFTFVELLRHRQIDFSFTDMPGSGARAHIKNQFQHFLLNGGFPEIQEYPRYDRVKVLQEYVHTVIYRDIVERHNISSLQPLKRLLSATLNAPATLFSVNKFYNHLRSQQIPCKKDALYSYIDYLHDAYLLFPVHLATRSEKARQVNPAKIYPIDTGLAHAHSKQTEPDWSHLLETFVFLELRKREYQIGYYKTDKGHEIDFITKPKYAKSTALIQVCVTMKDTQTRNREIRALEAGMKELQLSESLLISADEHDEIKTDSGKITIIPAWLWAIQIDREHQSESTSEQDTAGLFNL